MGNDELVIGLTVFESGIIDLIFTFNEYDTYSISRSHKMMDTNVSMEIQLLILWAYVLYI